MQIGNTLMADRVQGEVQYFYDGFGPSVFGEISVDLLTQYGGGFEMGLMNASGGWIASAIDLVRFWACFLIPGLSFQTSSCLIYMVSDKQRETGFMVPAGFWMARKLLTHRRPRR